MVRIVSGIAYDGDILTQCKDPVKKVTVEYGTKIIGDFAFQNQKDLEEIIIPNTVLEIGKHAFEFCDSLKRVVIPSSVLKIPESAFSCTDCLEEIQVDNDNLYFKVIDGILYKWDELLLCPSKKTGVVKIPEGIRKICDGAFIYSELKEVVLPESLEVIGSEAFGVSGIEKINIPKNVKEIGDIAFHGCYSLRRIDVYASKIACGRSLFEEGGVEELELFIGKDVSDINPEFLCTGVEGTPPMRIIEKGNPYFLG